MEPESDLKCTGQLLYLFIYQNSLKYETHSPEKFIWVPDQTCPGLSGTSPGLALKVLFLETP